MLHRRIPIGEPIDLDRTLAITVTLRVATARVLVEVIDDGGTAVPTLHRDDDLAETGRGLWLVDAFSLAWDCYQSATHTIIWFECASEPLP